MAKRSERKPLYELIRDVKPLQSRSSDADDAADQRPPEQGAGGYRGDRTWLSRAQYPIVLRIPRGLAVMIAAGLLGLVILAYWVGYQRAAVKIDPSGSESTRRGGTPSPAVDPPAGRFEEGHYYFILELPSDPTRPDETQRELNRLLAFLQAEAVDAKVVSSNNDVIRIAFARGYLRGFGESEIPGDAYSEYQARLRAVGRTWKNQHGGATDFSSMQAEKYLGKK